MPFTFIIGYLQAYRYCPAYLLPKHQRYPSCLNTTSPCFGACLYYLSPGILGVIYVGFKANDSQWT